MKLTEYIYVRKATTESSLYLESIKGISKLNRDQFQGLIHALQRLLNEIEPNLTPEIERVVKQTESSMQVVDSLEKRIHALEDQCNKILEDRE